MPLKIDTLFYELDARTAGFERNITRSQQSVDDFAKFIVNKPMLAVAAFGASLLAIGVAATKMADEVDVALRKATAAFPQANKEMERMRGIVEQLSEITPRSQVEIAEAAARLAEVGVDNVAELQLRLRKAVDLADATGTDLISVIEGLDVVGDAFGLSAKGAADAVTQIFGAAQGKVGLDEVFTTLERGGSVLASLGVSATAAGEAMVALIDAGIPRRQAGTVLTTILELTSRVKQLKAAGGEQEEVGRLIERTLSRQNVEAKGLTGALGDFAKEVQQGNRDLSEYGIRANTVNAIQRVSAAALADSRTETEKLAAAQTKLEAAAATNRSSASALAKILKNELAESLIRLGNDLLPAAIKLIDGLTSAMRRLKGEGNPLKDLDLLGGKLPTVAALGRNNFRRGTRFETADESFAGDFQHALEGTITRAGRYGADAFSGLTVEQLQRIMHNIDEFARKQPDAARALGDGGKLAATMVALEQALVDAKNTGEGKVGGKPAGGTTHVEDLTKEVRNAISALRRSVEQALVGETDTKIDDARQRVAAFREEVDKLEKQAHQKLPDLQKEGDRLQTAVGETEAKERTEAARKIADEVAQSIGLQSRIMEQGLKDFLADVAKRNAEYAKLGLAPLFSDAQIAQIREMRQGLIDATIAAEQADAAINKSHALTDPTTGRPNRIRAAGILSDQIEALDAERTTTSADTPAGLEKRRRLQEQINKLQRELNGLQDENAKGLADAATAEQNRLALLQESAAAIGQAAGLALQLGQAFGLVDASAAGMLQSVVSAAAGIGPFIETLKSFRGGGEGAASITQVLAGASTVIGGVTAAAGLLGSLFGESPESKERIRLQKENNAAIDRLTKRIGDLATIGVTGTDVDRFGKFLETTRPRNAGDILGTGQGNQAILDALKAMNLSAEQLKEFAKQYGVTVGTARDGRITFDDLDKLRQAMRSSELTSFGDTFAGQLQEMDAEIKLFDLKDPIKQFELFRKALDNVKDGGGILAETLHDFDLSTAEGVQKAQDALQALFAQLQAGTLDPTKLGGLTPQQFLDALLKAGELIKTAAPPGSGGFNVDRTITEVTGSRLAAIASTSQIFLQQIAESTRAMALRLGATTLPALVPPAVGDASTSGASIVIGDINVTIAAPAGMSDGQALAIGQRIGDATVQSINKALGSDLRWRARGRGAITR